MHKFKGPRDSKHAQKRRVRWEDLPYQGVKQECQAVPSKTVWSGSWVDRWRSSAERGARAQGCVW